MDAQFENWTLLNRIISGLFCISFPPEPNPIGYIGSASGEIFKIEGNTISYDGWAAGNGLIYHTTNGGSQWESESQQLNLEDIELFDVSVTDANTAYAVGNRRSTLHPVFLKYMGETGVEEMLVPEIEIYPNPTTGKFIVQSLKGKDEFLTIELMDVYGKALETKNQEPGTKNQELSNKHLELDITLLPAGIYCIRINLENQLIVKKIIKL